MTLLLALALAWAAYGALHSVLASDAVKRAIAGRWPRLAARYRLAYNAVAVASLAPVLALHGAATGGAPLWQWKGAAGVVADLVAVGATALFLWTLRWYDGAAFLGLRPVAATPAPRLVLSPLHRHVRHPWYALGLAVLWTRDMDPAMLVTALAVSGYLAIGARLEDRRLVAEFGAPYRRYLARVPGLLPWPGRCLGRAEAEALAAAVARGQASPSSQA